MVDSGLRSSWEASLTSRCWAALAAFESDEHGVHRRGKVGDLLARSGHRHTLLKVGARDRRHLSTNGFHRPQRRSHQPVGAHDHQHDDERRTDREQGGHLGDDGFDGFAVCADEDGDGPAGHRGRPR